MDLGNSSRDRSQNSHGDSSVQKEFLSIIHLGGIERREVSNMLAVINASATINDAIIVSGVDGRISLRVEIVTQHLQLKDIRLELAKVYPNVRFKLMSTGSNSLSRKLYLKISRVHTKPILTGYFSAFGEVRKIELKFNSSTHRSRNFCYITFASPESAQKAIMFGLHHISAKPVTCFACKPFDIRSHEPNTTVIELKNELEMLNSKDLVPTIPRNESDSRLEDWTTANSQQKKGFRTDTKSVRVAKTDANFGLKSTESPPNFFQTQHQLAHIRGDPTVGESWLTKYLSRGALSNKPGSEYQCPKMLQSVESNHSEDGNLVFNVHARGVQRR